MTFKYSFSFLRRINIDYFIFKLGKMCFDHHEKIQMMTKFFKMWNFVIFSFLIQYHLHFIIFSLPLCLIHKEWFAFLGQSTLHTFIGNTHKHSVGLAILLNFYQVSDKTRFEPSGIWKRKGRPKKIRTGHNK